MTPLKTTGWPKSQDQTFFRLIRRGGLAQQHGVSLEHVVSQILPLITRFHFAAIGPPQCKFQPGKLDTPNPVRPAGTVLILSDFTRDAPVRRSGRPDAV